MLLWIGLILAWFTLALIQLTYIASVNQERLNQPIFMLCLGMFLAAIFGIIIGYFREFARVPGEEQQRDRGVR